MKTKILIFASLLTLISSCDFPDHYFTAEPVCKSENIDDLREENQKMLVDKLKNKQSMDYRYFFKTFTEEDSNTYMITNFRNNESCFDIKILVDKWDKLAGMKRTNGYSYPNELYNLKWKIISIDGKEVIKYIDMHKIID